MEQRISLITLGVKNLATSRRFYENMGWKSTGKEFENVVFYNLNGLVLSLYEWSMLAQDAQVPESGTGFRGVTLAYNVRDKEAVARTLREAENAGARIIKPAQDVFWGGHSGYFADPDGHLWEVAWNPFGNFDEKGNFSA